MRAALLCLCFVFAAGCKVKNPNFCEGETNNLCQGDGGIDAPESCSLSDPCTTGVCKEPPGVCVQCLVNTDCPTATPICNPTTNRCETCSKHADCASAVCLDNGTCSAKDPVLYVNSSTGANTGTCTFDAPCATVSFALAVTPMRSIVKIDGTITETSELTFNNRDIVIYGETTPQSIVRRTNGNEIVRIDGTSAVSIYGLQLSDATGNNGHAISILGGSTGAITLKRVRLANNGGLGLNAVGSGSLHLSQSNVFSNASGGINIENMHTLDITSNFFTNNGSAAITTGSEKGGVRVTANRMTSKVEFNTIAFNQSNGIVNRGGFTCLAPNVSAAGNIVYRNGEPDGVGGTKFDMTTQNSTANSCNYGNSFITFFDATHLGFKSPLVAPLDYHLGTTPSANVVNMGGACTIRDVDNEQRPSGAGCELGADEIP